MDLIENARTYDQILKFDVGGGSGKQGQIVEILRNIHALVWRVKWADTKEIEYLSMYEVLNSGSNIAITKKVKLITDSLFFSILFFR